MSQVLKDPRQYVNHYLGVKAITCNERGELIDGKGRNNLEIFDTLYLDYDAQAKAHNYAEKQKAPNLRDLVSPISDKMMQKALNELISDKRTEFRTQAIQALKCTGEDLSLLKQFIEAITGSTSDEDVAIMAHWMWQVKKKMNNEIPSYHVMPIFFGKQEGGKTVALNKLIGPIANFKMALSLDQMTDDRYFKSMSENFVIFFDEMERADRTDIDALKKQVTIDFNDYRPLGTNNVFKVRQACSFIGATNRPVAEQIVDSTGMRRFWQVNCLDKLNWNIISNLDYVKMWQGIDETKVDGYILTKITEIRARQQSLVAKEEIQEFMESFQIIPGQTPTKRVTVDEMYQSYKTWAQDNGFKLMNKVWFCRKISTKGMNSSVVKAHQKTYNVYEVNNDCTVHSAIFSQPSMKHSYMIVTNPVTGTQETI